MHKSDYNTEREQLAQQGKRRCRTCNEVKPETQMAPNKSNYRGYENRCRDCKLAANRSGGKDRTPLQSRLYNGAKQAKQCGRRAYRVTQEQVLKEWTRRGLDPNRCAYCDVVLSMDKEAPEFFNIDHLEPLCLKGSKGHAKANLIPCCASCNKQKHSKHLVQFLASREHPADPVTVEQLTKACWTQPVKQSAPVGEPVEMLFCEYMHTFMREPEFEAVG